MTLRIILYGLLAFAPNADTNPTSVTVLLPDSSGHLYSSDGCRMSPHIPALVVRAAGCLESSGTPDTVVNCDFHSALPRSDSQGLMGSWPLNRDHVTIEVKSADGTPIQLPALTVPKTRSNPSSSFPASSTEAMDFSWVPHLAPTAEGAQVNPECVTGTDCPIAARMPLAVGQLTTCHLAELDSTKTHRALGLAQMRLFLKGSELKMLESLDASKYIAGFDLRPLGSRAVGQGAAMADAVMVSVPGVPADAVITITLDGLDQLRRTTIDLRGGGSDVYVWMVNIVNPNTRHTPSPCHPPGIDKHFETYYDLAKPSKGTGRPLSLALRPLPHAVEGRTAPTSLQPQDRCELLEFRIPGPVGGDLTACGNYSFSGGQSGGGSN
jgi:hypothetical protein